MYKILTFFFLIFSFSNSQILFSEYAEGSSYNKYLEIYNYSNEEIDLSGYAFPSCSNGCDQEGEWDYMNYFPDGAIIPVGGVYVITHPYATDPSNDYYTADIAVFSNHQFQFLGNGNDAVGLVNLDSGQILDIVGSMSADAPDDGWDVAGVLEATKDHVLVRKSNISVGNGGDWVASAGTNANDSDWIVLDNEVWSNLGFHEYDGGVTIIFGCTDSEALNFNPLATNDDGSCEYAEIDGCTDPLALNFNPLATNDDGSCEYAQEEGCADSSACNYDSSVNSALFSYVTTDSNMTIAIEESVGNSVGLELGDMLGVFYTNDSNELTCAGTAIWNNEALAIAAWGSESGLDNGFTPTEEFIFIVQKLNGTMFLLDSSMNNEPPFSSTYEPNGFGQVLDFVGSSPYFDLANCEYPEQYYDCFGNCLNDADGDGICDEFELDIKENSINSLNLIKVVNVLGKDSADDVQHQILFEIFENGVVNKKIIIN